MKLTIEAIVYKIDICQCNSYVMVIRYEDVNKKEIVGMYNSLRECKEKIDKDFFYNFQQKHGQRFVKRIACWCYKQIPYTLKNISEEELCEKEFEEKRNKKAYRN